MDQTLKRTWSGGAADPVTYNPTYSGGTSVEHDAEIVGNQANQRSQLAFDAGTLRLIQITVTGNETQTVLLETNNSGTPDDQFTFPVGGGCLEWAEDSPITNPFTADVTDFFWTHTGTETVTVKVRALYGTAP